MSFFSFLKNNKESYSLVFNIGSGSVSGSIIKFTEKSGVDMVYYSRELIPFQQNISVPKHLELLKFSLTNLVNRIQFDGFKILSPKDQNNFFIDRIFYFFSSPWSISQTKTVKISEQKEFRITENLLHKIVAEQENNFQIDISKSGKIIEKKIIQLKINNSSVDNFYNKVTKNLELSVYFTVVPKEILQTLEKVVSKNFAVKNIWCHSLSLSVFSVVRDLFPNDENYIHLDISEEITDVSFVKNNIMTNVTSVPFGRNYFIREISKSLNVTAEVANSMIKMHCLKNFDELASLKLAVVMDKIASSWLSKISEIFKTFGELNTTNPVFLISNSDLIIFLKDKLQKQDYKVITINTQKVKPSIVTDDQSLKLELMFLDNLYKI